MNAERLLAHYEQIADAPDAVGRLQRFILNLAVRGKLVPQDPKDEPASELLKRIAKEKAGLVKAGMIKKSEPVEDLTSAEQSFPAPDGWAVSNLQSVCISVTDGDHLPPPKAESGIPFLVIGNVRSQRIDFDGSRFVPLEYYDALDPIRRPRCGDLLYTLVGSYGIPVIVRDDRPFCVQRHIGILRPSTLIDVRFLERAMGSRFAFDQATACATGIAQKTVSLFGLRKLLLPLPPLAEQHRIVAKVDELMALCDRLEAAREEREATRDRLAASSLARLNAPDPETFQDDARFVLNALPALTTRPDQIKQLRQTILNLAVRGKLVQQDPKDEPAAELLKRIAKEKERLVEAGEARKLEVDTIESDDVPYLAPRNWTWTRLGSVGDWGSGSTPPRGNLDFYGGNVTWLKSGELNDNRQLAGSEETVTQLALAKCSFRLNRPGDVLIAMYGATIGKVAILDESAVTNQAVCGCTPFAGVFNQFLFLFLLSQREKFHLASEGGAQPNISKVKIVGTAFPLPPLAEQHRIVAKVDELMSLCDQLEVGLTDAAATRRRLLDALLAGALEPAKVQEMEAVA